MEESFWTDFRRNKASKKLKKPSQENKSDCTTCTGIVQVSTPNDIRFELGTQGGDGRMFLIWD